MINFNINNKSAVTLTKKGAEILTEYYEDMPTFCGDRKVYKEGDMYYGELWQMFNIFGRHIYMGCDIPFEDNRISIEVEGENTGEVDKEKLDELAVEYAKKEFNGKDGNVIYEAAYQCCIDDFKAGYKKAKELVIKQTQEEII